MIENPRVRLICRVVASTAAYAIVMAVLLRFTAITPEREGRGHDGRYYAALSHDERCPDSFIPVAPFCYRVLTPWLAGLLHGPVVERFRILDVLAWWATLVAFHALLRRHGLTQSECYMGCGLLAISAWGPAAALYNPCYVDPMMYLFIIIGLILVDRRSPWLALLLPVAMLQREQCMIVWVCGIVHDRRHGAWSKGRAAYYAAILAACATVYISIHLTIQPVFDTTPQPWRVAPSVIKWMIEDPSYAVKSALAVLYALGVPLIAVAVLPRAREWIRGQRWPVWYLALSALTLLAGSDKARLVFIAMPVLILASMHGLRGLAAHPRFGRLLATLILLHVYIQFPPHLMLRDGHIQAPLIDEMDRGTHGANALHGPGYWPVSLATVALHVLGCAAMGAGLLVNARRETTISSHDSGAEPAKGIAISPPVGAAAG